MTGNKRVKTVGFFLICLLLLSVAFVCVGCTKENAFPTHGIPVGGGNETEQDKSENSDGYEIVDPIENNGNFQTK